MRLFVSIDIPDYVKQQIDTIQKKLQEDMIFNGKPTPLSQLHMTLKYIGDVPEEQIPFISSALKTVQFNKTVATLDHVDLFVDDGVNTIYIDVDCPVLGILVDTLESALDSWCLYDNVPFIPHITLFWVSHVYDKHSLLKKLAEYPLEKTSFEINEFKLKKVLVEESQMIYETVARYDLV